MKTRRQFATVVSSFALTLGLAPFVAVAQSDWPSKPIRWIVPSPPGSPIDSIARTLGESVGKRLGTTIIIDNKPGAAGTIGAGEVARAAPDGYTFLCTVGDALIGVLATMKSIPYDPRTDFTFISKVAQNGPMLMAHPSLKANDLKELVAESRGGANLAYGSWGPGSLPMQVMESFAKDAGIKLTEIPYRGGPPALQDLIGGRVMMTAVAPHLAAPLVAEGKLKPLAVISKDRSPMFPKVQTFAEAGFGGFIFTNEIWVGILGPAKMDPTIRDRFAQSVQASIKEPRILKFMTDTGFTAVGNPPAEFEQQYRAEVAVVPKLISDLGVKPQ